MNKKGSEAMNTAIVALILSGIVIFVYLAIFRPTTSEAGTFFSAETLKAKDAKCKFDGDRAFERSIKFKDIDEDGHPDSCDVCISSDKKSNNDEDSDLDGMPTYCDKNDNDRTITVCKSSLTITKDGRCVEGVAS